MNNSDIGVLLVESDPNVLWRVKYTLQTCGYYTRIVHTWVQIESAINERPPDLMLMATKVFRRGGNIWALGYDICTVIKRSNPDIAVIGLVDSNDSHSEMYTAAWKMHADDVMYLHEAYNKVTLERKIELTLAPKEPQ